MAHGVHSVHGPVMEQEVRVCQPQFPVCTVPPSGPSLFPPDCATHARPLHSAALAFVSYGIVLVRVRVRFPCSQEPY
jgi:hypothetical protein